MEAEEVMKEGIWRALPGPWGELAGPLARAALRALEEHGLVVAPREPTAAMINAPKDLDLLFNGEEARRVWRAMLDAAGRSDAPSRHVETEGQ